MITKCPFTKDELKVQIEKVYGNNQHQITFLEIDNQKREVRWKFDNQTWTQGQSFEVLNVLKLTGRKPIELFKEEYDKQHPNQHHCSMPNIPAMLEAWAKEFNERQK